MSTQLPLLRRYRGSATATPAPGVTGATVRFCWLRARREIVNLGPNVTLGARRSGKKLGGFLLIAWSRYGE